MKILKLDSPIILGELCNYSTGIYKEIEESKIPKKYLKPLHNLGGCGVKADKYYRSNTSDETLHKYFEKVDDIVKFKPIHDLTFKRLSIEKSFKENLEILKNILNNDSIFEIKSFLDKDIRITYTVPTNCLEVIEHKYIEYKDFFLGRETFEIEFRFISDDENLYKYFRNKYEIFKFSYLENIEKFINTVDIQLFSVYYSKRENIFFEGNKNTRR